MPDQTTTSEVLNSAADLIQSKGWATLQNPGGPGSSCAAIAITKVESDPRLMIEVAWVFARYIGGTRTPDIFDWNDAPGRTASEVIEALRACAVIEASCERETAQVSA